MTHSHSLDRSYLAGVSHLQVAPASTQGRKNEKHKSAEQSLLSAHAQRADLETKEANKNRRFFGKRGAYDLRFGWQFRRREQKDRNRNGFHQLHPVQEFAFASLHCPLELSLLQFLQLKAAIHRNQIASSSK